MKTAADIPKRMAVFFAVLSILGLAAMGGAARPAGTPSTPAEASTSVEAVAPSEAAQPQAADAAGSGSVQAEGVVPAAAKTQAATSGRSLAEADPSTDPAAAAVDAAPGPAPILPPYDLQGAQAPDPDRLYVILQWKCDNPPKALKGYNVYRVDVTSSDTLPDLGNPYDTAKKPYYEDNKVEAGHTYRYWVTALSKSGEESKPSNTVDVEVVKIAVPSTPTGLAAYLVDPGVSLDWDPNPEGDIAGYNVYVSKNPSSRRTKLNGDPVPANHYYHQAGNSGLYYWVSAVNRYGLESQAAMAVPAALTPVIVEEDDASISVSGLWVIEHYVGPNNGRIRVAGDAGASLVLRFKGSQVKVAVAQYWSCGSAQVYLDGKPLSTINLYSEATTYNVIDLSVPGLARGEHTLTIEALGSGNPSHPYNFINVDYFEVR
jgi:hypothetical protein